MEIQLHRQINEIPRERETEKVKKKSMKEKGCRRSFGSTAFPTKDSEKHLFPLKCIAARHGR